MGGPGADTAPGPPAHPRPNVVVICVDTLRADHFTPEITPNLWRVAERGVHFPRAYAEFPLTVPFRVSAVTGTYTFTNRPWSGLRPSDRHLAEMCAKAGYRTAAFTDTPFRADVGMDRGFETFVELAGKLRHPSVYTGAGSDLPAPWIPDHRADDRDRWSSYERGWRLARDAAGSATVGVGALVDGAIGWLDARDHASPYLLWLDTFECHEPWLSPRDAAVASADLWPWQRFLPIPPGPSDDWMSSNDRDQVRALYRAEVEHADTQLGRLVDRLAGEGAWDDTVVVVMSDHGVPLGEHGQVRKYDVPMYDEMSRIAWAVSAPGSLSGAVSDQLVQTPDLVATLVELCGLDVDPPYAYGDGVDFPGGIEGHSLVPALTGRRGTREHAFMGAFGTRAAIVRWPYKFVDRRGERSDELYELASDPGETTNRVAAEPELAADLHRRLWRFQHRWARALRV